MPESVKPDIRLVLEHYGWTGRATGYGQWRNTQCPFHGDDRNPSARVNEDEGVFHCFTCEVSGDAYALVMTVEQCDFLTAKEKVKEITGVDYDGMAERAVTDRPARLVSSKLPLWARERHGLASGAGKLTSGTDSHGRRPGRLVLSMHDRPYPGRTPLRKNLVQWSHHRDA